MSPPDAPFHTVRVHLNDALWQQHRRWLIEKYCEALTAETAATVAKDWRHIDVTKISEIAAALTTLIADQGNVCLLWALENELPMAYFLGVVKVCVGEVPGAIGYINGLYVAPHKRGGGVGQQLLDHGMRWFRERGLPLVELYSAVGNSAGRRFWLRNGFQVTEEVMLRKV